MTTQIKMTRAAAGHYSYTAPDGTQFDVERMLTNWGDMQWMVDVTGPGKMVETFCVDTLAQVRHNIAIWNN
jgi:hypothetical protein